MTIKEVHIQGPIRPNLVEADCFTCWSAGVILEQIDHGFKGSEPISQTEEFIVMDAAKQHEKKKGIGHNIVIYHFKNDPEEKSDNMIELKEDYEQSSN